MVHVNNVNNFLKPLYCPCALTIGSAPARHVAPIVNRLYRRLATDIR